MIDNKRQHQLHQLLYYDHANSNDMYATSARLAKNDTTRCNVNFVNNYNSFM